MCGGLTELLLPSWRPAQDDGGVAEESRSPLAAVHDELEARAAEGGLNGLAARLCDSVLRAAEVFMEPYTRGMERAVDSLPDESWETRKRPSPIPERE